MGPDIIAQFAFATLLPVVASVALKALRRQKAVARIPERTWQVIVGIVFGVIAIYGTERGIPVGGAIMNVRDAAPLAAGLLFGGPAGIIAGVIGAVERWFSVLWGAGEFTRLACTLGTLFAGVFAALLRKFMFERNIPNLAFSFASGVVAEVMHLMLIFVTNLDQAEQAFTVVHACAIPMSCCVGLSMMLSSLAVSLLEHKPLITPAAKRNIVRILHTRMLIAVVVAFFLTVGFTALLQTNLSRAQTNDLLQLNIEDVKADILDASNENLLALTRHTASILPSVANATNEECTTLAKELDVAEIDIINEGGIIVASSNPALVGFDMASGEQSAEFLSLLPEGGQEQLVQSYQPMTYDNSVWRKYAGIAVNGGFIQVGYDASNFLDDLSTQVGRSIKNRHVGQTGTFVIIDAAGSVQSTYGALSADESAQLLADSKEAGANQLFTTMLGGENYYACYEEVESYSIVALQPFNEANAWRDNSVLIMSFMEVIVFAALFLIIYAVIKLVVVRGIRKMNVQLGQITKGDLDVQVDVRNASELSSLSDDINMTVGALKTSLAAVQADLDMAAEIQMNILPTITKTISTRTEFELSSSMEPAKEVGGDFYDFFMVDEDHLALVVADVSGKGVPAALFMMLSKTVIKMESLSGIDPAEVLMRANTDLTEKNDDDMFTTAWVGVLEISTGKLTYADAGHEKMAIYHNGSWELPPKPNGAVALATFDLEDYDGLPEKYRFRNHVITLEPGDAIFQYTDGVTEATNANEELFGEERLLAALNDAPAEDPSTILPLVRERISVFVGDAPQFDDITMLALHYLGPKKHGVSHPARGWKIHSES